MGPTGFNQKKGTRYDSIAHVVAFRFSIQKLINDVERRCIHLLLITMHLGSMAYYRMDGMSSWMASSIPSLPERPPTSTYTTSKPSIVVERSTAGAAPPPPSVLCRIVCSLVRIEEARPFSRHHRLENRFQETNSWPGQ
jgi:hypothetical protein